MTREELIISEAKKYYSENIQCYDAFLYGAQFAEEHPINVWHPASEEPKYGEDIIAICDNIPVAGVFEKYSFNKKGIFRYHCLMCEWYSPQKWETVDKWAYVKDLAPKKN